MKKESIIKLVSLLAIISIIIVSIFNSAIKDGKFICNRYILNSYLFWAKKQYKTSLFVTRQVCDERDLKIQFYLTARAERQPAVGDRR